jgi:hypothetical protein
LTYQTLRQAVINENISVKKKNENIITNNTNHTVAKALSRPKKTSRELSKLKPKHKNYEKQSSSSRPYEEQYQYITPIIHYD